MKPNWRALLILAAAALAHPAMAAECTKVVVTSHPDYKPYHWYDGRELTGASIELARRILDDMRIPYEIRYVGPWPRVLKLAENGQVDIVMSLKNTPERRDYLDFTPTPAFSNPMAVFVRRDKSFAFDRREDLIGKRGGVNSGDRYGEGFDEFLRNNLAVEPTIEMASNFKKLKAGRIDYYITGLYPGLAFLADNAMDDLVPLPKPVNRGVIHVGFTHKSPCAFLLSGFELRLRQLAERHETDKLLDKYLGVLRDTARAPGNNK